MITVSLKKSNLIFFKVYKAEVLIFINGCCLKRLPSIGTCLYNYILSACEAVTNRFRKQFSFNTVTSKSSIPHHDFLARFNRPNVHMNINYVHIVQNWRTEVRATSRWIHDFGRSHPIVKHLWIFSFYICVKNILTIQENTLLVDIHVLSVNISFST